MRLILALAVMLMGALIAAGVPETIIVGPYNVSFDLNTTIPHSFQVTTKPIQTNDSTTYMMLMRTNNTTMGNVAIIEYKNLTDSTLNLGKIVAEKSLISYGFAFNMSTLPERIDGRNGTITMGLDTNKTIVFLINYWLDSKDCECGPVSVGKINVEAISFYPPIVTWNLLSSLHVEKAQQKKQTKSLTFAPPT
jgi:hypothetical protein